jgi:hypothetical protein
MNTKYQLIFIGDKNILIDEIKKIFLSHIIELGLKEEFFEFIDHNDFKTTYKANAPAFCLYFGNVNGNYADLDILKILLTKASLILPIVNDLAEFKKYIPHELRKINGFQLSSAEDIERLVSNILEGLSLLRLTRRLFISYKRDESSTVAIQLFEQLEKSGFDVFLDTHSIRPGEVFQDELWHRLADTDVVVLLNTPGFLKSNWATQELAKANSMSIGIVQLIWPKHKEEVDAELSIPLQLSEADFGNLKFSNFKSYLINATIKKIVNEVESLRARSLAARQNNIITEFIKAATKLSVPINLQAEKFIIMERKDGKYIVIIPTVGVPQAFTYHQCEELVKQIKSKDVVGTYLLYDHINIREKWIEHLAWLDQYLKVKTIKIFEVENKIKQLVNA